MSHPDDNDLGAEWTVIVFLFFLFMGFIGTVATFLYILYKGITWLI